MRLGGGRSGISPRTHAQELLTPACLPHPWGKQPELCSPLLPHWECFERAEQGLTAGLNAPDRAILAHTGKRHQGQVLCAQEGRRGALGDGGTLIHLCSSAPVPTPVEAKGKAHPGHSTSNILASPWWASGLWLWFQLSQPARAPLCWPSAPPGLVQALLLIYIFIVCLPGFSPERFIFHSRFDMTAQASFSRKDKAAPLEICHIAKDIYFS